MTEEVQFDVLISIYEQKQHELNIFMKGVLSYIGDHPELNDQQHPIIHSYKSRLKDSDHLKDKIRRKIAEGRDINEDTLFHEITDLAGVRFLHLYQEDFSRIDEKIREKVAAGDWHLSERPKAYTWDPEAVSYFKNFDLLVSEKPTAYTSVHYLVRPRPESPICCEIQVRTLFEEIWGEVDHRINYPHPTESIACREQLRVLSKVVGAGSRLLDALSRVQNAENNNRPV